MNRIIEALRPTFIHRVAGSGNKFIHMVEEKSNYYINFVPGFKLWDMCAADALVQARFGIVTDGDQKPLKYARDT